MAAIIENNKITIMLSNTESISSSIYNYSDLNKTKESSISSTSSYFLSTNGDISRQIVEYLDCDNSIFVVDTKKTRQYISLLDYILDSYDVKDFHGELRDYFLYKDYYRYNRDFEIGYAKASIENGTSGRSYLRFNNEDDAVKRFRGIIVAIFSNIIIERIDDKNYIYPEIKKEVLDMYYEDIKKRFKKYMLDIKNLSEASADQYIEYIDISSNDAINDGIIDKSIYDYLDAEEVKDLLESLRQNDRFNTITFKRNHINTAAIGNYINYLEYRSNNNQITNDSKPTISTNLADLESRLEELSKGISTSDDDNEKMNSTREIIKICYELLNHYK